MIVDLRYFSGTGNSYRIIDTCKETFDQRGCRTTLLPITDNQEINQEAQLVGFCFPVYAYGIPRICRNYLSNLSGLKKPVDAFVLITAGDPDEAGFAVRESVNIMKDKGLKVIYSDVIHMPANWTVSLNPPPKEEALRLISSGVAKAIEAGDNILNGVEHHHRFNYPARLSKFSFYKDYYLFKWLGVGNLWRNFRVDETCDSCGLCMKICPTGSIQMEGKLPSWANTCEQCMRCVNYCPKQAIFQSREGSVKGKNIYHEPTFNPLKLRDKNT